MVAIVTEISVFEKGGRKVADNHRSLLPMQAVDRLVEGLAREEREEGRKKAEKALRDMRNLDSDLLQFFIGETRVRIKQTAK